MNVLINENKKRDTSMSKELRNVLFDVARGIGMILVVFAHVNYTPELLRYIYSFHMPLFFIIAGMLFKRDRYCSFGTFFKTKLYRLIYPYCFFYILSLLISFGVNIVSQGLSDDLLKQYFYYLLEMFIARKSATMINGPLWFVPCLFVVEMLYYFVSNLKIQWNILINILFVCIGWLWESGALGLDNVITFWSIDSAMFAVGFYAIGNLARCKTEYYLDRIENSKSKIEIIIIGVIICILSLYPLSILNGKVSLGSKILNNGLLLYLTGIIGTIGVLLFAVIAKNSKILRFFGKNSFCIMSIHCIIRNIIIEAYKLFGTKTYDNMKFSETIIPFLGVLIMSLIFTLIYNKAKKILWNIKDKIFETQPS